MAKLIDTQMVRDHLGDIINQAHYRGDEFLVQRRGKPVVAIIPVETYEQLLRERNEAFRVFHEIWEANKDVDHEQLLKDIEQAVAEVREEKRRKREQ